MRKEQSHMSQLKTRERFPSTIDKNYLTILRHLSKTTRIPMSTLMDEALELLFEQKQYKTKINTVKH